MAANSEKKKQKKLKNIIIIIIEDEMTSCNFIEIQYLFLVFSKKKKKSFPRVMTYYQR